MDRTSKILVTILALTVVILVFVILKLQGILKFEEKYQVVVLKTGEVYFGKLSFFPSPHLKDAWFVRQENKGKEGEEPNLMLYPVSSLYFAPKNVIYFPKESISWWANLSEEGRVSTLIKSQKVQISQPQIPPQTSPKETPKQETLQEKK